MYDELEKFLSKERMESYLEKAGYNKERAVLYYEFNVMVSHSFYVELHFIEISLRNKINNALIKSFGKDWYLNNNLLLGNNKEKGISTIEKINDAIENIKKRKLEKKLEPIINNCDVISYLDFGFWTNLFCSNYKNNIWDKCLRYEFEDFSRREINKKLNKLRNIRNRIYHYEPIEFLKNLKNTCN